VGVLGIARELLLQVLLLLVLIMGVGFGQGTDMNTVGCV
jgi:hypothetical protein